MSKPSADDAFREETERLRLLDKDTQRQIIEIHRSTADNKRAPKSDRDAARVRADALERLLGLAKRRKGTK
jgi:hypothetical protein